MRQVRCIRPRAGIKVGDLAEVPDDAKVSDLYWEPVEPQEPPSPPAGPGTTPGPVSTPPVSSGASSAPADKDGAK
jgi:hypothetical protein